MKAEKSASPRPTLRRSSTKPRVKPTAKKPPVAHPMDAPSRKGRSIVDETFAALPIRKHTQIEQLLMQTRYGE